MLYVSMPQARFFEVYRIPQTRTDVRQSRRRQFAAVVVISESMMKLFWKDGDPLTDRIVIGRGTMMNEFQSEPERRIIGIVGDVRPTGLMDAPAPSMYIPQGQVSDAVSALDSQISPMAWVVRARGDPRGLGAAIQERLRESSGLPVSNIQSMSDVVSQSTSRQRFNMLLMTAFGSCALLLAAIGIYGLMTYSVEQRTQEIGICLALGAGAAQVKSTIVFQGMRLALAGVAIGTVSAFGLTHFIASFLFGVQAQDPMVFITVPIVMSAGVFLAVWFPASRASRIDPIKALRYE